MMKTKTILKVLSFVLVLALAVTAVLLTGCGSTVEEDLKNTQDELDSLITEFKAEKEKVKQLEEQLATLTENSATRAELEEQLNQAKARLTALEQQYMVTAKFQEATEYLFTHDRNDPKYAWSLDAFEAKIAQDSFLYYPADFNEYKAEAKNMWEKLFRATSLDEIKDTFAKLDKLFDEMPTLAERVREQLNAVERDKIGYYNLFKTTFYGATVDQLVPLSEYYNTMLSRQLIADDDDEEEAADENLLHENDMERAARIFAARDRLDEAEADAQDAYAEAVGLGLGEGDVTTFYADTLAKIQYIGGLYEDIDNYYFDTEAAVGEDEDGHPILEDWTELYRITVKDLTGWRVYNAHLLRYQELNSAYINFRDVVYDQLTELPHFKTEDPMYTDYSDVEGKDGVKIDDWASRYHLVRIETINEVKVDVEEINRQIIINRVDEEKTSHKLGGYNRVAAIRYYVQELNRIYTELVKGVDVGEGRNLAEQIKVEIDKTAAKVLYTHRTILEKLFDAIDDVDDAIAELVENGYNATKATTNYRQMLGLELQADRNVLAEIEERYYTLLGLAYAIDLIDQDLCSPLYIAPVTREETGDKLIVLEALSTLSLDVNDWQATFANSKKITKTVPAQIEAIFNIDGYRVTDEDTTTNKANYDEITKNIFEHLEVLNKCLEEAIREIQRIYDQIRDDLRDDESPNYLTSLQRVLWAYSEFVAKQGDAKVDDIDFDLKDDTKDEQGNYLEEGGKIAYSEVFSRLAVKLIKVVAVAEEADAAAISLNRQIAALGTYNLNKTGAYDTAIAKTIAWAEAYLGILQGDLDGDGELDTDADTHELIPETNADYLARIAKYFAQADENGSNQCILGIEDFNKQNGSTYTFIADFATLKAGEATYTRIIAAAKAAWANVNMKPDANNIALDASFTAFINYVRTYYTEDPTATDSNETIVDFYSLQPETQLAEIIYNDPDADEPTEIGRTVTDPESGIKATYKTTYRTVTDPTTGEDVQEPVYTLEMVTNETLRQKANRYATYIENQQFGELSDYNEQLCPRDRDYQEIISRAAELNLYNVPDYESDNGMETFYATLNAGAVTLKNRIEAYRNAFEEYAGEFLYYNTEDAVTLNAELIAYKAQAKAIIVKAIDNDDVKDVITYTLNNTTMVYHLDNWDHIKSLTTAYCYQVNQNPTITVVVESTYALFLQTAFDVVPPEYATFSFYGFSF